MIPILQPVYQRWDETQISLLDCLSQFPADRYRWHPGPKASCAGDILLHIARGETGYARMALGQPREPLEAAVADHASALAVLQTAADRARDAFERLTEADLEQVVAEVWHPLSTKVEGPMTPLWFLEQMIRHKAYHLGQLWYISLLLEEDPPAGRFS